MRLSRWDVERSREHRREHSRRGRRARACWSAPRRRTARRRRRRGGELPARAPRSSPRAKSTRRARAPLSPLEGEGGRARRREARATASSSSPKGWSRGASLRTSEQALAETRAALEVCVTRSATPTAWSPRPTRRRRARRDSGGAARLHFARPEAQEDVNGPVYSATAVVIRHTGAANWTVANLSGVQTFFSSTFGRPLPTAPSARRPRTTAWASTTAAPWTWPSTPTAPRAAPSSTTSTPRHQLHRLPRRRPRLRHRPAHPHRPPFRSQAVVKAVKSTPINRTQRRLAALKRRVTVSSYAACYRCNRSGAGGVCLNVGDWMAVLLTF